MIQHSVAGLLFFNVGRELRIEAYDVSRTNAVVHAEGLGLLPINFYLTFDGFLTVAKAGSSGGVGMISASSLKDGLISASGWRSTRRADRAQSLQNLILERHAFRIVFGKPLVGRCGGLCARRAGPTFRSLCNTGTNPPIKAQHLEP